MSRLLFFFLALSACNPPPKASVPPGFIEENGTFEARVDGHAISSDMIESGRSHLPAPQKKQFDEDPKMKQQLLERIVVAELLYHQAIEDDLHKDPEVQRAIAMATREVLANRKMSKVGEDAATDEAVQEKYDSMKLRFNQKGYRIKHLLVKEQDLATSLAEQIRGGADFGQLARSHDPQAKENGGDLGWVQRAPLPELQEVFDSAELNSVSGPVETRRGFHVVPVMERRDSTPLDEVKDQLADMVKVDAMKAYQSDLKLNANIHYGPD